MVRFERTGGYRYSFGFRRSRPGSWGCSRGRNLNHSIEFIAGLASRTLYPLFRISHWTKVPGQPLLKTTWPSLSQSTMEAKAGACVMQLDNGFPKIDLTEFADLLEDGLL